MPWFTQSQRSVLVCVETEMLYARLGVEDPDAREARLQAGDRARQLDGLVELPFLFQVVRGSTGCSRRARDAPIAMPGRTSHVADSSHLIRRRQTPRPATVVIATVRYAEAASSIAAIAPASTCTRVSPCHPVPSTALSTSRVRAA